MTPQPTIVLVHGAWADASSWNRVTKLLQPEGHAVVALANPLRGITSDSAYIASVFAALLVAALRFRQYISHEFLLGLGGVLSMVFGVAVLAQPAIGIITFALVFGVYAILVGITQVWLGLRLRGMREPVPVAGEAAGSAVP